MTYLCTIQANEYEPNYIKLKDEWDYEALVRPTGNRGDTWVNSQQVFCVYQATQRVLLTVDRPGVT